VLVMGLVETALMMRAQLVLTNATREAARLASRGQGAEEVAQRAMVAFSEQLPARTSGPDTNTGIIVTLVYVPALPEDPPVTSRTYFSGTAKLDTYTGTYTCTTRVPAGYRDDLVKEHQDSDGSHDVAIVEVCHSYRPAFFPIQRFFTLYDKTTMRISAQRAQ
jgi:Flp pilus assembly protein TadG